MVTKNVLRVVRFAFFVFLSFAMMIVLVARFYFREPHDISKVVFFGLSSPFVFTGFLFFVWMLLREIVNDPKKGMTFKKALALAGIAAWLIIIFIFYTVFLF